MILKRISSYQKTLWKILGGIFDLQKAEEKILELNTESYRMNAAKLAKSHSHKSTKKTEENDMKITWFFYN